MKTTSLKVSLDTASAIKRGHPWIYRDQHLRGNVGDLAQLVDHNGRHLAWALLDDGPIAARILSREQDFHPSMGQFLRDRISRADRLRLRLLTADTNAYRVTNGEGDGIPGLIVDRYGDVAVVRLYSAAWEPWLEDITDAVRRLGWAQTIYRRYGVKRVDGLQGGDVLYGEEPADQIIVQEHGMKLIARPKVGQKTGLFIDQREHRHLVRQWSAGRNVVNLFAYNGGFSVAAALGGASRVTTLDIAPDAIEDAKENFRINDIDPNEHEFVVADAFKWSPNSFLDFLIVDPPSLTHGKQADGAAKRAYRKLHKRVAHWIPRGGLLATSSCTARLTQHLWKQILAEALAGEGDWSWHWSSVEPTDHPTSLAHTEAQYLKFALLHRR